MLCDAALRCGWLEGVTSHGRQVGQAIGIESEKSAGFAIGRQRHLDFSTNPRSLDQGILCTATRLSVKGFQVTDPPAPIPTYKIQELSSFSFLEETRGSCEFP